MSRYFLSVVKSAKSLKTKERHLSETKHFSVSDLHGTNHSIFTKKQEFLLVFGCG